MVENKKSLISSMKLTKKAIVARKPEAPRKSAEKKPVGEVNRAKRVICSWGSAPILWALRLAPVVLLIASSAFAQTRPMAPQDVNAKAVGLHRLLVLEARVSGSPDGHTFPGSQKARPPYTSRFLRTARWTRNNSAAICSSQQ